MDVLGENDWAISFADICLILMLAIVMTLMGKYLIKSYPDIVVVPSRVDVFVQIIGNKKIEVKCNGKIGLKNLTSVIENALLEVNKVQVSIHGDKNIPLWYIVNINNAIEKAKTGGKKIIPTYDLLGGVR